MQKRGRNKCTGQYSRAYSGVKHTFQTSLFLTLPKAVEVYLPFRNKGKPPGIIYLIILVFIYLIT